MSDWHAHRLVAGFLIIASVLPAHLCAADSPWIARGKVGMVASDSPEASQIGAEVLKAGGNAFDAAVATSFALAVARPQSTGLGGGGFMVAYVAGEKRFVALDFRETAPTGATAEYYAKLQVDRADGPSPSVYGGNAVAVPGQLAGLAEINKRFGTRRFAALIQPAIKLAEAGFTIDEHFLNARNGLLEDFEKWPELAKGHAPLRDLVLSDRLPVSVGDTLKRPDLANALDLIAEDGPDAFYNGPIGEAIVAAVRKAGGVMTMDDLRGYRVKEREPLRSTYFDFKNEYAIVGMPPPSSGGVCLAEILNIVQATRDRSDLHPVDDQPHVLIEAMKHAFADRARWLGDPGFSEIPVNRLTNKAYAGFIAPNIRSDRAGSPAGYGSPSVPVDDIQPSDYGGGMPPDDRGTSHFCVADKHGNIVAITETINGTFGSLVVAEPYGIILNNEMDDFATAPDQPNLYGLIHGKANRVGPGKRPLSSMTPTIIFKDGKPFLVVGASGGPRIITSVLQVALHAIDGKPIEKAMTESRLHHQWRPDEVYFDRKPPAGLVENLERLGHKISERRKTAAVQAIRFLDDGTMVGASDPHKGGRPAGAD
jgi:gamma-glutamyltranspeptidase/glutathione hydrolase